jgi:hypothetical protein
MESTTRLFADDCVIYRKIIEKEDMDILQNDLDRLGEWATENAMEINPSKSKAILKKIHKIYSRVSDILVNCLRT